LVEPPDLGLVTVWSLDDHLSAVDNFEVSVRSKSRLNVEWSLDIESEFFIESLRWTLTLVIKIDNLPFLVEAIVFAIDDNWSSFFVFVSRDIEAFLVLPIDKVLITVGENLPPTRVSAPNLHICSSS
jgi:hypothetical protein